MITYEFNLDMSHGGLPLKFGLKQYDSDFSLIFKLFARKGTLNITSGTTVKIRGTKPDGRGYSVAASLSGSTVTVTGDQQMTAVAGMVPFELTLVKSGKELNTATFFVYVERAALDLNTIPSESKIQELYDLTESVDDILEAAASVEAAAESIANESAQIAKNKEINEIQQGLIPDLYTKKTDIDVSSTISNYALKGDGTRKSDSNSELKIYTVTAGNVLYLSLANDSDCTYQWQNSSTVPTSGTPTALIGTPVTGAVDTFVRVPTGATRLIVSKLKTTSTNIVKSATAKTDENAQAIENFRITVDDTLSQTGEAADAAAVGAAINTLNGSLAHLSLPDEVKVALLDCFKHSAWIDNNGPNCYASLHDALYPNTSLDHITAVFTQGSFVVEPETPLNALKPYLTVTAHYKDGVSITTTGYVLSGTLTAGTSTVTVTKDGKTASFNVTVTNNPALIYKLPSGTDISNQAIDTNVPVFGANEDFTILTKARMTALPNDNNTKYLLNHGYLATGTLRLGLIFNANYKTLTFISNVMYQDNVPISITGTEYACDVMYVIRMRNKRVTKKLYIDNTCYIDKDEDISSYISDKVFTGNYMISAFANTSETNGFFPGVVNLLAIYNSALTDDKIESIMGIEI